MVARAGDFDRAETWRCRLGGFGSTERKLWPGVSGRAPSCVAREMRRASAPRMSGDGERHTPRRCMRRLARGVSLFALHAAFGATSVAAQDCADAQSNCGMLLAAGYPCDMDLHSLISSMPAGSQLSMVRAQSRRLVVQLGA
eukprot:COSAG02_NODE_336_length_24344_cov_63.239101_6_plen_142_part_00